MKRIVDWMFAGTLLGMSGGAFGVPIYVGNFNVFDGPSWQDAPVPLSARDTAALLFGGSATDYAIPIDATTITHTAWVGFNYTNYVWRLGTIDPDPIPVPEPAMLSLLGIGFLSDLLVYCQRKV